MRKIILPFLLMLALATYGQQTSVAVLPSDGTAIGNEELEALTDKMRVVALKVLPTNTFVLLKQDVIVKRLGGAEKYIKECIESSCIVDLGQKAQVDYVSQASVSKLGNKIRLKVELYNVRTEGLIGICDGEAENINGLLDIVEKRVPAEVFGKIPGASDGSMAVSPIVANGMSGVESTGGYNANYEKSYLVDINTEPAGAVLSFNGVSIAGCTKTPCWAKLPEGSIRIVATLEQYETADIVVSITHNNQDITITLRPNFRVVNIGNQVWMAENLNYNANGSKCYDSKKSNCQKYGRLYDWNTAKNICPKGWHLPSKVEWQTLVDFAGGSKVAGNVLKASNGWSSNGNGTNDYGFSALPGGIGRSNGGFDHIGNYSGWWSATEHNASSAYGRDLDCNSASALSFYDDKTYHYVRCLQD